MTPLSSSPGVVTLPSPHSFADTVARLLAAFADHKIKVFAVIDQQSEASAVGVILPPTTLILFGNPKAGTPLMVTRPASGLDLPLKVLVSESVPGAVSVFFNAARYVLERHGLPGELAANLSPAEGLIAKVLAEE